MRLRELPPLMRWTFWWYGFDLDLNLDILQIIPIQSLDADTYSVRINKQMTPLMFATYYGWQDYVKRLFACNADPRVANPDNETAISYALDNFENAQYGRSHGYPRSTLNLFLPVFTSDELSEFIKKNQHSPHFAFFLPLCDWLLGCIFEREQEKDIMDRNSKNSKKMEEDEGTVRPYYNKTMTFQRSIDYSFPLIDTAMPTLSTSLVVPYDRMVCR